MADYISIQDILEAGITNMSVIRDNVRNDDGWDLVTGVDWFTFNGSVATNIYVSGNSVIGFGSQTEHLRINRLDTQSVSVYREEGTLYGFYSFLKIRWVGYSYYGAAYVGNPAYFYQYDVILFDTGDILLNMIDIPESNYNGTFNLVADKTYTYTAPTVSSPYVLFSSQENNSYTIEYRLPNLLPPFDKKWLVSDKNGIFYSIRDGILVEIPVNEISATAFIDYGMDDTPDGSLLLGLNNPKIYYWQDSDYPISNITAEMKVTRFPQTIITEGIDITNDTILGVENTTSVYTGNPLVAVSFDMQTTWDIFDGNNWVTSDEGMTLAMMDSITSEAWNNKIMDVSRLYFKLILQTNDDSIASITINYLN